MVSPYLLKPLRSLREARDADAAGSGVTSRRRRAPGAVNGTGGRPDPEVLAEPTAWAPAVPVAGAPVNTNER